MKSIEDVDRSGVRIAVSERSAYDLWLSRNIQSAELIRAKGLDASYELFVNEKLDALAGLRPKLMEENEKMAGIFDDSQLEIIKIKKALSLRKKKNKSKKGKGGSKAKKG